MILEDADRLDALGAIGILRTATCGNLMGARYYDPSAPSATSRALDDTRNTLDHFPVKLLRLAEKFNTAAGRREAEQRTGYMREFLREIGWELPWSLKGPDDRLPTTTI